MRSPVPSLRNEGEAKKFTKATRYLSNLTPTTKEERISFKQTHRNNGIYDLLGKNLRKK